MDYKLALQGIQNTKENTRGITTLIKKDKVNYGIVNEKKGKRGGRYEMRVSKKTGKPYRHYF